MLKRMYLFITCMWVNIVNFNNDKHGAGEGTGRSPRRPGEIGPQMRGGGGVCWKSVGLVEVQGGHGSSQVGGVWWGRREGSN